MKKKKGFTLIEILIVIGIIILLSAIVIVAIDPGRQIKIAQDNQRRAHVNVIYGAIREYSSRNNGDYPPCIIGTEEVNIIDCQEDIVPLYLSQIPEDPEENCYYFVKKNTVGRVGVRASCSASEEIITSGEWSN